MINDSYQIPGGGEGSTEELKRNDVNFYDYDGTLLYSYTYEEACKLKSLPPAPQHDGLVFQEWNYTLDDIKEQGTETIIGKADVGANYITDDEATKVVIVPKKASSNVYLYIKAGFYPDERFSAIGDVIDWGDGTIETISEETKSSWDNVYISHIYQEVKEYTVRYWRNNSNVVAGIDSIAYADLLKILGFGKNAAVRQIKDMNAEMFGFNVPKGSSINIGFSDNYIGYIVVPRDFVYYSTYGNSRGYCEGVSLPSTITTLEDSVLYNVMIEKVILPRNINVLDGGYGMFAFAPIKNFIANGLTYIYCAFYGVYFQQEELYFPVLLDGNFNGSRINTLKVNNGCERLDGIENVSVLDCRECTFIPELGTTYKNAYQTIIVPDELYDEWVSSTNWSSLISNYVKSSLINW